MTKPMGHHMQEVRVVVDREKSSERDTNKTAMLWYSCAGTQKRKIEDLALCGVFRKDPEKR